MKRNTIIFAALIIIGMNAKAQHQKTIINWPVKHKFGVAISPSYEISRIDNASASFFGVRGGIVLVDKITVGGAFKTSVNKIIPKSETDNRVYLHTYMFGGLIEYTLWSANAVHLTFPLIIGTGKVEMDRLDGIRNISGQPYGEKYFFFAEPSALLEINLHKYVRLNAGANYRFVGKMAYRNFNQSALSGISGVVGLKLGKF